MAGTLIFGVEMKKRTERSVTQNLRESDGGGGQDVQVKPSSAEETEGGGAVRRKEGRSTRTVRLWAYQRGCHCLSNILEKLNKLHCRWP